MQRVALLLAMGGVLIACGSNVESAADSTNALVDAPPLIGLATVRPVDEAPRDPAFLALRDTLRAIVARRDTAALAAHMARDIAYSFGMGEPGGIFAHWIRYESLDRMWRELDDILSHGGRFSSPEDFSAPWTHTALPDSLDAFQHLIVRDSGVAVRSTADTSAPVIGTLSWTVVQSGGDRADSAWRGILLPDGRTAYVETPHIRSPLDYRVGFVKRQGRWLIHYFIAGD